MLEWWTFVALVISPDSSRFYLNSGNGLDSVVITTSHDAKEHGVSYAIGRNSNQASRQFKEQIDNVRMIARSLDIDEISALSRLGLGACNPQPTIREKMIGPDQQLEWTPSALQSSERLYLSSNYTEVLSDSEGGSCHIDLPRWRGSARR
jgi:hypothetical protein